MNRKVKFLNVNESNWKRCNRNREKRKDKWMWDTKAAQPLPSATTGISFLFCNFALFLLHLISLKYSLQLSLHPPSPKDLFIEAESLNPGSLSSSEAARWQLLMSMLMTTPQPGERSEHLCTASSQRPRCQQSWIFIFGEVRWGEGFGGKGGTKRVFFSKYGALWMYSWKTKMNETNSPELLSFRVVAD